MSLDHSSAFTNTNSISNHHSQLSQQPPSPNNHEFQLHANALEHSRTWADVALQPDSATSHNDDEPSVIRITQLSHTASEPNDLAEFQNKPVLASELVHEVLSKIFSFLDPLSLARSSAVCRSWYNIAKDDAIWRAAFATFFNLEIPAPQSSLAIGYTTVPSLRRLNHMSWKAEFQQRVNLLRQWRKARNASLLSNPKVDLINAISISKQHRFMLSVSQTYGVASRSNPFTGKVIKGYLDADGLANGAGNGNPNVEFSPNVTAISLGADATTLIWGFRSGEVGITTLARQGINPRSSIKSFHFSPTTSHVGPITSISLPFASDRGGAHSLAKSPDKLGQLLSSMAEVSSTFVTAGHDGTVRLWCSFRSRPLWVGSTSMDPSSSIVTSNHTPPVTQSRQPLAPICAVDYDPRSGVIAAGNVRGTIFVWSNLNVVAMLSLPETDAHLQRDGDSQQNVDTQHPSHNLTHQIPTAVMEPFAGSGVETAVCSLFIDALSSDTAKSPPVHKFNILAHHSGARVFLRHHINTLPGAAENDPIYCHHEEVTISTTVFGAAVMDEITAIRPDFDIRLSHSKSSSLATPLDSKYGSPVTSDSCKPSTCSIPSLVLGPSPYITATASGLYPERKYICVGTKAGSLFLFDWEAQGIEFDQETQEQWQGGRPIRFKGTNQVLPMLGWEAHHTSITALDMSPLNIFVGTSDGTIKVFCSLSGELIRTINDRTAGRHPARMLAAGEFTLDEAARFRVQQIIADNDSLVAAIGHQVLTFRAEPLVRAKDKKAIAAARRNNKLFNRPSDSKFQMNIELKQDLQESQAQLDAERKDRQAHYERIRSQAAHFELGDLSEQEAFEYAMMLSRDEEETRLTHKVIESSPNRAPDASSSSSSRQSVDVNEDLFEDPDLADALEQIALAESRQDTRAQSTAAATERTWSLDDDNAFSDLGLDDLNDPKLSGYLRPSTSPSPHTVSNSQQSPTPLLPELASPSDFPAMSPPTHSQGTGLDLKDSGGIEMSLTTCSKSSTDGRTLGAWTRSPSLQPSSNAPVAITSPSLLTASLGCTNNLSNIPVQTLGSTSPSPSPSPSTLDNVSQGLDDDLRFAIELSLAEERSRLESTRQ